MAWVTDLKTGQPVTGVKVRFADGTNDVSAMTGPRRHRLRQAARRRQPGNRSSPSPPTKAGGFGVASTSWQDGIAPWDFGTQGGAEAVPYVGYVYTDRPIYRPGQTVYWKAHHPPRQRRAATPCPRRASRSP